MDSQVDDDVEVVLPFNDPENPLNERLLSSIQNKTRQWRQGGLTPLYLSMQLALTQFQSVPNAAAKHLIVITDGVDNVNWDEELASQLLKDVGRAERGADGRTQYRYNETDLRKLVSEKYRDVKIDVLGIGIKKEDFQDELNTINADSLQKGKFIAVGDATELGAEIKRSLGLLDYEVRDVDGRMGALRKSVDEICPIRYWPAATQFRVSIPDMAPPPQDALLRAEGGEAFELQLDEGRTRIVHERYKPENRNVKEGSAPGLYVSAFYETRDLDSATFHVTVQNENAELFSPKPIGVWATITPTRTQLGEEPIAPPRHFYDLVFVNNKPVPVLKFQFSQWPPDAYGAKIELWFRVANGIDPEFPDIDAWERNPRENETFSADIPGVEFTVDRSRLEVGDGQKILVTEQYEEGADLWQARVMTDPQPDSTRRHFDPHRRVALHEFVFYGRELNHLVITPREAIERLYTGLTKPIMIKLPDAQ
jgi:hypothetical protein